MEINTQIVEIRIEALQDLKSLIEVINLYFCQNPNQKSKYDKSDIKKRCLTLWKIPVLNFGPAIQEYKKGNNKNDKTKVPSLHELARAYTDIDHYEKNVEVIISI